MPYRCVFFDLDHTLWDYDTNSAVALRDLYRIYSLDKLGASSFERFHETFLRINTMLWDDYDRGLIPREVLRLERFHRVLKAVGIDDYPMSLRFSDDYLRESPKGSSLIPAAKEMLDYLSASYPLYIITNGFAEIQSTKILSSGIDKYFKSVVTSEAVGFKKPDPRIFEFVLQQEGFAAHEAVMIGDNLLTDIAGARNAGVDQVFFNPNGSTHDEIVTYEIQNLGELKQIL